MHAQRNFLHPKDLTSPQLDAILALSETIATQMKQGKQEKTLSGKILAALFFEPSTRTRLSFEAAMLRLGGQVIHVTEEASSSLQKGESFEDMGRMLSHYADVIVMRHPDAQACQRLAQFATIPVINAGSGTAHHPTQALLDYYTMRQEKHSLDHLQLTFFGDLKYGRTTSSLLEFLLPHRIKVNLVSPNQLRMSQAVLQSFLARGMLIEEFTDIHAVIAESDILYVNRIQRERFPDESSYQKVQGAYQVNLSLLTHAKKNLTVMHPLPRLDEISSDIDTDPRAVYFRQAENGLYVRMALLNNLVAAP